jgi:hypothetical protein
MNEKNMTLIIDPTLDRFKGSPASLKKLSEANRRLAEAPLPLLLQVKSKDTKKTKK